MFRPKFLNINERALERIDHPFSYGMLRLQFDNDNNRLGKYVNDINDCEGENMITMTMIMLKMTRVILVVGV